MIDPIESLILLWIVLLIWIAWMVYRESQADYRKKDRSSPAVPSKEEQKELKDLKKRIARLWDEVQRDFYQEFKDSWTRVVMFFTRPNKFFIVGLLIYFIPSFVFWGIIFSTTPTQGPLYLDMWFFVFIGFLILTLFTIPALLLISQWWYMLPYFALTYGLLYYFYRRQKGQNKPNV